MELDLQHRLLLVFATLASLAILEAWRPDRPLLMGRAKRWSGNIGLFAIDVVCVGIPLNALVFGALLWTQESQMGVMNWLGLPVTVKFVIGFLALDAMFYFQHRLSHRLPILWRLHRVHHADTEMDVTTANRIHPLESVWVTFLRIALAVSVGIPIAAFVAFVITLNIWSLVNHANVKIPEAFERIVRLVLVTPKMHETHHSAHIDDYDTNFGFIFSFWDRLFGTHKSDTSLVGTTIQLGLDEFRAPREHDLPQLLTMPFRSAIPS